MYQNMNENPLDFDISSPNNQPEPLEVTEVTIDMWLKTSNWFTFLGGLLFFIALVLVLAFRAAASSLEGLGVGGGVVLVILIILTVIPAIFYWSAGSKIRLGFMRSETEIVEKGFKHLLWAYRYSGIVIILYLTLMIASIAVGVYNRFS